jgi:hypothetical protein
MDNRVFGMGYDQVPNNESVLCPTTTQVAAIPVAGRWKSFGAVLMRWPMLLMFGKRPAGASGGDICVVQILICRLDFPEQIDGSARQEVYVT